LPQAKRKEEEEDRHRKGAASGTKSMNLINVGGQETGFWGDADDSKLTWE